MLALNRRAKQTLSRVCPVLLCPDPTSESQPLGFTVLSSPLYGSGGLLINSPVTPGKDDVIADSGMTTLASQHESALYIHTMSSSSSSAEKPSGTDWSTFCQRTGVWTLQNESEDILLLFECSDSVWRVRGHADGDGFCLSESSEVQTCLYLTLQPRSGVDRGPDLIRAAGLLRRLQEQGNVITCVPVSQTC